MNGNLAGRVEESYGGNDSYWIIYNLIVSLLDKSRTTHVSKRAENSDMKFHGFVDNDKETTDTC